MKQGHLLGLFLMVYITCFMALFVEQKKYDNTLEKKQQVEGALLDAAYATMQSYETVINEAEEIRKRTVEEVFLESFYIEMGLFNSEEEQENLRMYLPVLILAEEDGAFYYFMQEIQTGETVELKHGWSEKIPYTASKEYDVFKTIEEHASFLASRHNYIAGQYGISYQFHAPSFLKEMSEEKELPILFVVFQGWPLSAAGDVVYENCIDAGIYIAPKEFYTVLEPKKLTEPYYVYHMPFCPLINENKDCRSYRGVLKEEAIRKYGAYACRYCIKK